MVKEKSHRLPEECYLGGVNVAYTICVEPSSGSLTHPIIFKNLLEIFQNVMIDHNCDILIYLFMSNHIHIIIKGKNDLSNSLKAIKMFKQKSGYWFSKNYPGIKWQKDFYDHIIRNDKDIENQIYYILNNPVRKNLIENWKDYEYKGSTVYDFNEWD